MNRREKVERKLDLLWSKIWYIRAWDEVVLHGRHTQIKPPHHGFFQRLLLIIQFGGYKAALFVLTRIERKEKSKQESKK